MKTYLPGTARRRETADAVRGRLSQLFVEPLPYGTGGSAVLCEAVAVAVGVATDGSDPPGWGAEAGATPAVEPVGVPPPAGPTGPPTTPAADRPEPTTSTPVPMSESAPGPGAGPRAVFVPEPGAEPRAASFPAPGTTSPSTAVPTSESTASPEAPPTVMPAPESTAPPAFMPAPESMPTAPPGSESASMPAYADGATPGASMPAAASASAGRPSPPPPDSSTAGPPLRLPLTLHPALAFDRRAVLGLSLLLVLAVGYAVQHFWLGRPQPVAIPAVAAGPTPGRSGPGPPAPASGAPVVVDVAGAVQSPGLRALPGGSRVADAIRAAGGAVPGTDTDSLNLARVLTDGEQILVGGPQPAGPAAPAGPLSLNRATPEQLDALPGVGPTLAQRIVQYRHDHGPFASLDQLRQVGGIGQRKFDDLKPLLTL